MKVAVRLIIVAYAVAATFWFFALTGLAFRWGDFGTGMIVVMAFGYGHILIAALLLVGAIVAGFELLRNSTARIAKNFCIFGLGLASLIVASWYSYFYFHE